MLLTISTTHQPATDLGYLLHKHPARVQSFPLGAGVAHVFYPEATDARCTAALLVEIDPVSLVRGRVGSGGDGALDQYVNDRPYAASSLLSVAIAEVYGSALSGRCAARSELVGVPMPLTAVVSALPLRGGEDLLRRLFEPLGYAVDVERVPLDEQISEWGESVYARATLQRYGTVRDLLNHLYVLVPVLDNAKHYFVDEAEVDKLLRHGGAWLSAHPERTLIAERYLKHRTSLARQAVARLLAEEMPQADAELDASDADGAEPEPITEREPGLGQQRIGAVLAVLRASGARRVLDLGCGEGRLLRALLDEPSFQAITGVDVSLRVLEKASDRLHLDRLPERQRERIRLLHGSLTYRDERLVGYDAAAVVEVIEHLDPSRLSAFERCLFGAARPPTVALTTPNAEYNVVWESLPADHVRHPDHRFEWTRAEFRSWCAGVSERFGYAVRWLPIGPENAEHGPPTQMAVFTLQDASPPA